MRKQGRGYEGNCPRWKLIYTQSLPPLSLTDSKPIIG